MNKIKFASVQPRVLVLGLLCLNFIIKVLVYFNTTAFDVSEAQSNFVFLERIEYGTLPALFSYSYRSILSYIGYYFFEITGSLDWFFIFQAILGTLSVYLLYLICLFVSKSIKAAIFTLVLSTLFTDFHLLTPVFYYQAFEVFFALLILYLTLLIIHKESKLNILWAILIPIVLYISVFFRGTLSYFWFLLPVIAAYFLNAGRRTVSYLFAISFLIAILLFSIIPHRIFQDENIQPNSFIFFGHTNYGGDGGEGDFVYEENRELYQQRLHEYMTDKGLDSVTIQIRNSFHRSEIGRYIYENPHKWFFLQIRKVAYTFGIIPIRDNLQILTTGVLPMKWYTAAIIVQIPYSLIMLLFVVLVCFKFNFSDLKKPQVFAVLILLFYLIAATCIYGHYSERYRTVTIMAGLLPLISFYLSKFTFPIRSDKQIIIRLTIALFIALIVLSHWGYQIYDALIVNKERYFDALEKF